MTNQMSREKFHFYMSVHRLVEFGRHAAQIKLR